MLNVNYLRIAVLLITCLGSLSLRAAELSQSNIDSLIKTIELFERSNDPILKSIDDTLQGEDGPTFDVDENGNIAIISALLKKIDKQQLTAVKGLIKQAGFTSLDSWVDTGNRVFAAMMAIQIEREGAQMEEITPEMLALVPEQMREQMQGLLNIMEAAKRIPKEDIAIVRKNIARLEAATR